MYFSACVIQTPIDSLDYIKGQLKKLWSAFKKKQPINQALFTSETHCVAAVISQLYYRLCASHGDKDVCIKYTRLIEYL